MKITDFFKGKFLSPGSTGGKIRKYRMLKGLTQRELGIKAGFTEGSADVRIAQYENNKKKPRGEALSSIAASLEVDPASLDHSDMAMVDHACHALFDMEDFYGLHSVKAGKQYFLSFDIDGSGGRDVFIKFDHAAFLKEWHEKRQALMPRSDDPDEEKKEKGE